MDLATRAGHTHILFKRTAEEICAAAYEELAKDNGFYKCWPNQKAFVVLHWGQFLSLARQHLVECLSSPRLPEAAKEEIFDALLKERAINQNIKPGYVPMMH